MSPNELNKMKPNSLIPYKNRQLRRVTNTAPPPAAFEYGLSKFFFRCSTFRSGGAQRRSISGVWGCRGLVGGRGVPLGVGKCIGMSLGLVALAMRCSFGRGKMRWSQSS